MQIKGEQPGTRISYFVVTHQYTKNESTINFLEPVILIKLNLWIHEAALHVYEITLIANWAAQSLAFCFWWS